MCRHLYTKKTNASIGKIRVINWCLLIVILESRTFQSISSSRCNLVELELCMHIFNVFINAIKIVCENGRAGSLLLHLVTASFIHSSRQRVMLGVSKPVPLTRIQLLAVANVTRCCSTNPTLLTRPAACKMSLQCDARFIAQKWANHNSNDMSFIALS